jgi:hypothetical protein
VTSVNVNSLGAEFVFARYQYQALRHRLASMVNKSRSSQVPMDEIDTSAGATYAVPSAQTLSFER